MAGRPEIINKSKASSHPLKPGRFYTGSVTAVLSNGKINVKIPELGTQYGPLMPLNTTSTSRYVVGDSVKCAFADEFFNEIIVFGSTRVKEDVFAVSDRGIDRYANQSARNADIPTPEEGRVVYLLDSDELQIYNGTEWITVIDTGNSENITAATLVATSASIGSLTVTSASTLTVLGSANLTASTTIGDISSTELSYLNGVTSAIQTQINTKSPSASPTFTGTATVRAASTQDGIILQGRAGGTNTYAVTMTPGTLTGNKTLTLPDTTGTVVTTGDSQTVTSTMIANDTIVNADINSAAAIVDTKLATISTAGKVANSATTATSANTANAIVARDASGNFSAGTATVAGITSTGNITIPTTSATYFGSANGSNFWRPIDAYNNSYFRIATGSFYADAGTYFFRNASSVDNLTIESGGTVTARSALQSGPAAVTMTSTGALQIGNAGANFAFGTWASNVTVGMLANCADIWEEAIHDSGARVVSKVYYSGNVLHHGRDLGWGKTGSYFYGGVYGDINYGSYGSITLNGTTGGYSGLSSPGTSSAFMFTNNICGHYYNNNSWNWYFDRGTLRMLGSDDYVLSYVDQNGALPWCKGPYLQGSNGWAFLNRSTGAWEMGQRYAPGGQNYAWVRGGLLIGTTPDDAFAGTATVAIRGSLSVDTLPNSTALDATYINAGGQNWKLAFNAWSTRKVKQDIGPIGEELDPSKLLNLDVVQFKYKPDHLGETDSIYNKFVCGLIAEDVAEIYPVVVRNDPETGEPQSINYQLLIPPLLALVQKMASKIDSLEERIFNLENP